MQILTTCTIYSHNLHDPAKFRRDRLNGCENIANFPFKYGGRSPSWIYEICKLTIPIVCGPNLHIHVKFRRDRMNGCWDIANFQFPIWRPSDILNFGNMQMLTFRTVYTHNLHACLCKISSQSLKRLWKYCESSISNMAAVRHLKLVKCANFKFLLGLKPQSAWSWKILSRTVEWFRKYCEFSIYNMNFENMHH